ncbi:MAG: VOC family protein [Candidatus Wallbacteria bacterium]|nr:VOC family protein [Candidatus Wallbacteria bacterium]
MAEIRHVLTILAVSDLKRAEKFYNEAFGFKTRVNVPVYIEYELPNGISFGIYKKDSFAINTGEKPFLPPSSAISGCEIYFHCDDLDQAIRNLKKAGARILSERKTRDWGDEAAYFADPDGNVLVLAQPILK